MPRKRIGDLLREEVQKSLEPEAENVQNGGESAQESPEPKIELETTVTDLRESLQEAQQRENSLQQQIADLQSDLQEQKTLVEKLEADIQRTNRLKAELEQARKVILQLSEANSKLTEEVNTLRKENEGLRSQKSSLNKLPHHSIQQNSPSTRLSNKDIGWVD